MYVYIYIYTHTYIHTYIHSYIHTYITLHYIALHCIALYYITLHYITLHTYVRTYVDEFHEFEKWLGYSQWYPAFHWLCAAPCSPDIAVFRLCQVSKEWILTHGIANLQVPFDMGSFRTLPLVIGDSFSWLLACAACDVLSMPLEVMFLIKPRPWLFGLHFWLSRRADSYGLWVLSMGSVT